MPTFHLQIVTPERLVYDDQVVSLVARTTQGDVGILKNHAKYVATLDVGVLRLTTEAGKRNAALAGGFINVGEDKTIIIAETCEWADEIDLERAKRAQEKAEARLHEKKSKRDIDIASYKLKKAATRIRVSEMDIGK